MALLSPPPKMQFFGDDGLPLSGGLVHTYSKDTTTPLATYTDSTGSVANSNPVALDSQGRANIWLQITPYSFVIYNSLGVLQSCSGSIEFPPAAVSGSDIAAWSDIVVYDYPDLVAGSDGFTYRCVGTNILDDDPVGSVTGAWINLSSIASPNLTGTPTAPTAAPGTNTTQIATTAFVQAAVASSAIGFDITGGDATVSANTLTFTPCVCRDSTGVIKLETTTNKTITAPTGAAWANNTLYYIYIVRLVSDSSIEFRAYPNDTAVTSDTQINVYRWIDFWNTNGSAALVGAKTVDGEKYFNAYNSLVTHSSIASASYIDITLSVLPTGKFSAWLPSIAAATGNSSTQPRNLYITHDGTQTHCSCFGYGGTVGLSMWMQGNSPTTWVWLPPTGCKVKTDGETWSLGIAGVRLRR